MRCDVTEIKSPLLTILSWWYLSTIVSYDSLGTATSFVFSENVIYLGQIFRRQLTWDMFVSKTFFSSGHLLMVDWHFFNRFAGYYWKQQKEVSNFKATLNSSSMFLSERYVSRFALKRNYTMNKWEEDV